MYVSETCTGSVSSCPHIWGKMWFSKLTSIPIRRLHGKEMVLFLFYHMRWCTGYGSFLCAFYSRKICIGVDFDFPGRTGPSSPFAVSFFDLVFFLVYIPLIYVPLCWSLAGVLCKRSCSCASLLCRIPCSFEAINT